jgi:hypothetical protein
MMQRDTGCPAIPDVQLNNGTMIRGWHKEKPGGFDAALFLDECSAALAKTPPPGHRISAQSV